MWFPKLSIYRDMHYLDSLTLKLGLNMLIYSAMFIGLAIILEFILTKFQKSKDRIIYKEAPSTELGIVKNSSSRSNGTPDKVIKEDISTLEVEKPGRSVKERMWDCLFYISKAFMFFGSLLLAFMPSLFSGSGRIPVLLSIIWAVTIFTLLVLYLLYFIFLPQESTTSIPNWTKMCWMFQRRFRTYRQVFKSKFLIVPAVLGFLSFFIPLATSGLCVTNFSDKYGFYWLEVRRVSSIFTRWFEISEVCPLGPPCHIYATVPEDTASSFFLNVHTHPEIEEITAFYEERSVYEKTKKTFYKKPAEAFPFRGAERLAHRNVHTVYIDNLKENTEYYVEIHYDGMKQAETVYKTLPGANSKAEVRIAMGGDVGSNYTVLDMNKEVAKYNPDILIIAGDAGYDDGLATCYYSWDLFFWYFEDMYDTLGRLVPLVIGVGNHDIGYNALANPEIELNEEGPMFYLFLPQNLPRNAKGREEPRVPALSERKPYFNHIVGNTIQLSLDSGYLVPFEGEQKQWIVEISKQHAGKAKFANYHVPVYPACFKPAIDDDRAPKLAEEHWVPLFEQMRFMSVFENHVHFYKRTKPLINGKEDPKGVVYLGDGAWGVVPNYCRGNDRPRKSESKIYEKTGSLNHVWMLTVTQDTVKYEPLGIDGNLIEEPFYQNIRDYISIDKKDM